MRGLFRVVPKEQGGSTRSGARPQVGVPRDLLATSHDLISSSHASSSVSLFFPCHQARPHPRLHQVQRRQAEAEDLKPSTTLIRALCK